MGNRAPTGIGFCINKVMDYLFLAFASILGLGGLSFTAYFAYSLLKTPQTGARTRSFNLWFLGLAGVVLLIGLALALFGDERTAAWGTVIAAADMAIVLLLLAAQGYGVGFKQMEEDGVGFIRFFQLGSSILFCLALAPAFFAFITYATRLR